MAFVTKIFKILNPFAYTQPVYATGPNTLDELIKQFDQPSISYNKDATVSYPIQLGLFALELDFLKSSPAQQFLGSQSWYDENGNKCFDFVPCMVRPEVIYCSYYKN